MPPTEIYCISRIPPRVPLIFNAACLFFVVVWQQVFFDPHDEVGFRSKLWYYAVEAPQEAAQIATR